MLMGYIDILPKNLWALQGKANAHQAAEESAGEQGIMRVKASPESLRLGAVENSDVAIIHIQRGALTREVIGTVHRQQMYSPVTTLNESTSLPGRQVRWALCLFRGRL